MAEMYEKLKQLREQSGLRQGQIASYLGVTQTFISKAETGERNLTSEQIEKLLHLYGYSSALFSDIYNPVPFRFGFRAQDLDSEDLEMLSEIGKLVINSRFMGELLQEFPERSKHG